MAFMFGLVNFVLFVTNSVYGFNLDVDQIRELRAEIDQKGALFGYSLAFYTDDHNRYFKIQLISPLQLMSTNSCLSLALSVCLSVCL